MRGHERPGAPRLRAPAPGLALGRRGGREGGTGRRGAGAAAPPAAAPRYPRSVPVPMPPAPAGPPLPWLGHGWVSICRRGRGRGRTEGRGAARRRSPEGFTWCRRGRGGARPEAGGRGGPSRLLPAESNGLPGGGGRGRSPPAPGGGSGPRGKVGAREGPGFVRGRAWGGDIVAGCSARYLWKEETGSRCWPGAEGVSAVAGNFVVFGACGFLIFLLSFPPFFFSQRGWGGVLFPGRCWRLSSLQQR